MSSAWTLWWTLDKHCDQIRPGPACPIPNTTWESNHSYEYGYRATASAVLWVFGSLVPLLLGFRNIFFRFLGSESPAKTRSLRRSMVNQPGANGDLNLDPASDPFKTKKASNSFRVCLWFGLSIPLGKISSSNVSD
jgi:hypothetical protein